MTAVEWLENEIDNELKVIDNLYGKEIMGRKIAFAFVKRILIEAKELEKQQKIEFACKVVEVSSDKYIQGKTTEQIAEELLTA